jgi:hypothetical protein
MANDVPWPGWPANWATWVQGGEDTIQVMADYPGGNEPQVGLQSAPAVTWLKKIRVLDGHNNEMATVSTQDDDHGPHWTILPKGWARLEFVKDKTALHVATGMYQTPPAGQLILYPVDIPPGWRLLFQWSKD